MARKLKVFRTPIGFHDAYVAAPSRKAALAAWGADADLFARGVAEEVTDPALMEAPIDRPGEVIRVARGTADEHLAALPPAKAKPQRDAERDRPASPAPAKRKRRPRPKRDALDAAEAALAEAVGRFEKAERDLAKRERALAAERERFEIERRRETAKLTDARDDAERRYRAALADWEP